MEKAEDTREAGKSPSLLPPQPPVPPNVKPESMKPPKYSIVSRPGVGTSGRRIPLLANHFQVSVNATDAVFYQYAVKICSEDDRAVESKGIGRKVVDQLFKTYTSKLAGKRFAYDGKKSLYTVGPLPQKKFELIIPLEETFAKRESGSPEGDGTGKRIKQSFRSKTYKVELSYSAEIPLKSIFLALNGAESDTQDALRVLDIVLRQQAANRGCLLVRQSFFDDDSRNYVVGGILGLQGFHSSFRPTQGGLSLNMDVSTTMIVQPEPVIEFLKANQNVKDAHQIDWQKAKRILKNMRIKTTHNNMEFKISGLSEKSCCELYFTKKVKNVDSGGEQTRVISVYEYFTEHCGMQLTYSAGLPCLDVGKAKRPSYLPLELCSLVSLQRYTKELSLIQRFTMLTPQERAEKLTHAVGISQYDGDPILSACRISVGKQLTEVIGRVLEAPRLQVGNGESCFPQRGRWNFNNKKLYDPKTIRNWVVVNFSAHCDIKDISRALINCARDKGIHMDEPEMFEEDSRHIGASSADRVDAMIEKIMKKLCSPPHFVLCILPVRKNSDIYGPWKIKCFSRKDSAIFTQCIGPPPKNLSNQYLTSLILKINTKLGGFNSLLKIEHPSDLLLVKDTPTLILGMDVSHGSPGQSDFPSIAAISRYRASMRTQAPKMEMIDALYKPLENGEDGGIIRELLVAFYETTRHKPKQIIVFRNGVSEYRFNQVLNIELEQIVKACQHLGESDIPKFTVIVVQKNHHTKFFQADSKVNVLPGTVVDTKIVHPRNYDFYMCAHAGMIGTSRPAHYHVLLDEIGFSPDALQNLIHSLSYVDQRGTTATSIVAPVRYALLAARQMGQLLKSKTVSETSSAPVTSAGGFAVQELPWLNENVAGSMFFC